MKAIVHKTTRQAIYYVNDDTPIVLSETGKVGRVNVLDISAETHDVVTVDPVVNFVPYAMVESNGTLIVNDVSLYNDVIAQREAEAAARETAIQDARNIKKITKQQLYLQLKALGKWGNLKSALALDEDLKDYFEASINFDIDHPQVVGMAAALGIDLQDAFNAAGAIQ